MNIVSKYARHGILLLLGIAILPAMFGEAILPGIDLANSSFVLIAVALLLTATDVISSSTTGTWFVVVQSIRKFGFWVLIGLLLNTLTVVFGLLALRWNDEPSLNALQSMFLPGLELAGLYGSFIFALFAALAFVSTAILVFDLTGWSLVKNDPKYAQTIGYKWQLTAAVFLIALVAGLISLSGAGYVVATALSYVVVPFSIGVFGIVIASGLKIFGSHPWRESASEIAWGSGRAVMVLFFMTGLQDGYLQIMDLYVRPENQELVWPYVTMISTLGVWIGAFLVIDTAVGAFSMYVFNSRKRWFVDVVSFEPMVLRKVLRTTAILMVMAYILIDPSGPVAIIADLDFGALAYGAYGMIMAIAIAGVIRLFVKTRIGVLVASIIVWSGIGLFSALFLANLPSLFETVAKIPNLTGVATGALPYAIAISNASWWLIGGIAIIGFVNTARSIDVVADRVGAPTLLSAAGFVGIGWMSWAVADAFSGFGPGFNLIGAIALGATFGGAISLIATFFVDETNSLSSHLAGWLAESRFRAVNVGGAAAAYLLILRSTIFDVFVYAPLLEWISVAFISTYIARRTLSLGKTLGGRRITEAPTAEWVGHSQSVDFVEEAAVSKVVNEYEAFVERDERSALIIRLSTVMWESGRTYDEILSVVSNLLSTSDAGGFNRLRSLGRFFSVLSDHNSTLQQDYRKNLLNTVSTVIQESSDNLVTGLKRRELNLDELMAEGEKVFVDTSDQSVLVTTCCVAFWSNGADRHSIRRALIPITRYQEPVVPWYGVGPLRRKWDALAHDLRLRAAEDLRRDMAYGGTA